MSHCIASNIQDFLLKECNSCIIEANFQKKKNSHLLFLRLVEAMTIGLPSLFPTCAMLYTSK